MKKLIWRIKFTRYMNRISKCGWSHAWYSSGVFADEEPECLEDDPEYWADEEMSCWD